VPAVPTGEAALHDVVVQVTLEAAFGPKLTEVVAVPATNPVPVMVTTVPPVSGPALGLMPVTLGIVS
jgi:hypothetical protein